jgi:hypothetical protein
VTSNKGSPEPWIAALLAVTTAILMTWPLLPQAGQLILRAAYHWDAYCNTMLLASRVDALTGSGPLALYDSYYFAPLRNSIVYNENHFGLSLLFAPFYLLTGAPLLAYNLTLLSSLSLSVFFTYVLVRRLTGSGPAGMLAGVAFAFCPYVLFEIGRIQLVATQWIPACFLFLHRAIEGHRRRDVAGLCACYLLQLGTCLYYALFLLPLLLAAAAMLVIARRPPARFFAWVAVLGVIALGVAFAMVAPYFTERAHFALDRSPAFAASYDGELSFFGNVPLTNRTLTGMRHELQPRAREEVAFPGFTALILAALASGRALFRHLQGPGRRQKERRLALGLTVLVISWLAAALSHSLLVGALVTLAAFAWELWRSSRANQLRGREGLYLGLLALSLLLFLGFVPFTYAGQPVRGLYDYLYTYVPGYSGIRKVSRQAIMTTFLVCIVASFGSAWLFQRLRSKGPRAALLGVLLGCTLLELRAFPHPLEAVWAGKTAPKLLDFVRTLPERDFVASLPQDAGIERFRGDAGMALHDYLAVLHKHRFVNGQSSYLPPVTDLMRRSLGSLPSDAARRALYAVGTRHLLLFEEDLPPAQRDLPTLLEADDIHYRRVFKEGTHSVFSLLDPGDPSLDLLDTPALPPGARLIPGTRLRAFSRLNPGSADWASDGQPGTRWSTGRPQQPGQALELRLSEPHSLLALEIENPGHVWDVPAAFELLGSIGDAEARSLHVRPQVRLYREQVFSPRTFVFRLVFDEPVLLDRLELRILGALPGYYFSVAEARLYEASN